VVRVEDEASRLRRSLTERLRESGAITSDHVSHAFERVPRHRLIGAFQVWDEDSDRTLDIPHDPEHPNSEHLALIYSDRALITRQTEGRPTSSSSMPSLMASMLEALELEAGMRVLEVGAGIGYNAALMAEIIGDQHAVTAIEIDETLIEQTRVRLGEAGYGWIDLRWGDGFERLSDPAPFDRIVSTVGCADLAPAWFEELAPGGRMLVPLQHAQLHPLVLVSSGGRDGRFVGLTGFVQASGKGDLAAPWPRAAWRTDAQPEERPGWPGFGFGPTRQGWGRPRDELDFLVFLSLRDRRAFDGPGVGLWEAPDRWAAATRDAILVVGNGTLVDELDALHREWLRMGSPTIERSFFRQFAWP
jgi:protein-L-isoaspartate(D-aspartate) O-methyltransferase